jgi:magnesium transporter
MQGPGDGAGSGAADCIPPLQDIRVFLGRSWLVTVGDVTEEDYAALCGHMQRQVFSRGRGASFLLFFFLDWAIGTLYPILDALGDRVDGLEDLVVSDERAVSMQTLFRLKRDLVELRRRVAPLRDVMQRLDSLEVSLVERAVEVYFRDLHDDVLRIIELLDTYRDILSSALDLHLSTVNNRLGEIMKRLTVVATVFMPLTFITGFFGMNFQRLPFEGVFWFIAAIVLMVAVPAAMLVYFRRKEWW